MLYLGTIKTHVIVVTYHNIVTLVLWLIAYSYWKNRFIIDHECLLITHVSLIMADCL